MADKFSVSLGMVYVLLYFCFVLGVPILVLGAGVFQVLLRVTSKGRLGEDRADGVNPHLFLGH